MKPQLSSGMKRSGRKGCVTASMTDTDAGSDTVPDAGEIGSAVM